MSCKENLNVTNRAVSRTITCNKETERYFPDIYYEFTKKNFRQFEFLYDTSRVVSNKSFLEMGSNLFQRD